MGQRIKLVTWLAAGGLILAILVAVFSSRNQSFQPPLPSPNGLDDFIRGALSLTGNYNELNKLGTNELRPLVVADAEALRTARVGFTRECRVPLPQSAAAFGESLMPVSSMRQLALALAAEGRLAELTGQPGAAADAYVDCMVLAQNLSRGGLIIHSMIALAVEAIGSLRLEKIIPQLDASTCHRLCKRLESLEVKREPINEIIRREHSWVWHAYGFRQQLTYLAELRQNRRLEQTHTGQVQTGMARCRRLILALAFHGYELETGHRPNTPADLVPGYLQTIPIDPVTGTNFVTVP